MAAPTALGILVLVLLLQLKHAVCDGPLQARWMVETKGVYGTKGGIAHASIHVAGSAIALAVFGVPVLLAVILSLADGVFHYHVDFVKEAMVKRRGWTPRDTQFWWMLAADQTLHHATYIAMAAIVVMQAGA